MPTLDRTFTSPFVLSLRVRTVQPRRSATVQIQGAARRMVKAHESHKQGVTDPVTASGAKHDDSVLGRAVQIQTYANAENLAGMSGQQRDCNDLQKQPEQHQPFIDTVTDQLIPAAKNPRVRDPLQTTLPMLTQYHRWLSMADPGSSGSEKQ